MSMVSTRNNKYKFSVGERVLCYEPDRTKAKVLYDSKVLEVKTGRDERGRKTVEYLIHFQGWNPSWDRCVGEDHVLKDTEENRRLQKELAEKSSLQIAAFLYRKDQKKKITSNEASNSCSSQEDGSNEEQEYLTATDDEKISLDSDDSMDQKIPLDLNQTMRNFLERDFDFIHNQNKLVKLPASPTVIQILEEYVRHLSSRVLRREADDHPRSRNRHSSSQPMEKTKELEWICARVNLSKETVDGLRICFDYYLGSQLLYSEERHQYEEYQSGKLYTPDVKKEAVSEDETDDMFSVGRGLHAQLNEESKDLERRRSLRSHKDPAVEPCTSNGVSKPSVRNMSVLGGQTNLQHCSAQSSSSTSSYYGPMSEANALLAAGAGPLTAELTKLNDLATAWRLVPDSYLNQQPQPPSVAYGAVHLARLFVKLPSFLHAANLPEKENQSRFLSEQKLKLLLYHLQSFLTFMEGKPEWFGEEHYINNPSHIPY